MEPLFIAGGAIVCWELGRFVGRLLGYRRLARLEERRDLRRARTR